MNYVIFDKWAVERVKWSSLIGIGDSLKRRGNRIEYFIPRYFAPERKPDTGEWGGDIPNMELQNTTGIFVWSFNPDTDRIIDFYKKNAPDVDIFTVDYGFLKREEGYWFVMKNNQFPSGCPDDRFKNLSLKLVGPQSKMFNPEGHILVCMQNHHEKWYDTAIKQLYQSAKNHKVRIREYDAEKPLADDLKGAFACVTYNSTALYQALLNRIPVFCDKTCAASVYCESNIFKIEKATKVEDDVLPFLYNVAYSQYTLQELKAGEFLEIL